MSDYIISQIYPSDILANKQINELLLAEGIRRDANLDLSGIRLHFPGAVRSRR